MGSFYEARSCAELDYMLSHIQNFTEAQYPECKAWYTGENPNQHAIVLADQDGDIGEVSTALGVSFGMAVWLALAIHAIGVEIYV